MTRKFFISSITLSLLLSFGCSQQTTSVQSTIENRTVIDTSTVNKKTIDNMVKSNNQFAFSLYQKLKSEDDNTLFSPYSINSALMLLLLGAEGETKKDIQNALYLKGSDSVIHTNFSVLNSKLSQSNLSIANALWPSKENKLQELYLKESLSYYGAKPRAVDYKTNPSESRKTINNWVEKITHEKIKDLIPDGVVDSSTKMVITNAIYFKGIWEDPFEKSSTKEGEFKLKNGEVIKVPFMQKKDYFYYYEDDKLQAAKIKYQKGLAMVLIKPKSGTLNLDSAYYDKIFHALYNKNIYLKMPKFKIATSTMGLKKPLQSIGLSSIFDNNANFSKLSKNSNLKVDDVLHKAYIQVDEEGTVAAAATGITMPMLVSIDEHPISMILDSAFVFMIVDDLSGEIVFLGDMKKPMSSL